LVFVAAALAVTWPYLHQIAPASDWGESETFVLQLPAVVGVIMVGWLLGMNLAKRIPWLKRLGVSRGVMTARVLIAAHHAFDSLHVHKTAGGTGVVIYVSLFEHRVCVWADRTVSAKIPESEWKEITEGLVRALGEGKPREGLVEAIRKCGEVLGKHFPVKPRDVNELPNELRILD
ncbi:MAG: hypothetical protein HY293_21825, partial [Planctomycetes bacterium]|nr:hypothetical protein [Planctomycetota bacterium]